jgi:RNA:NAD 2'-phosphotransferase (TPT1/KptA family)
MAIKNNPTRRFELVLEEAAAFAAAGNEQWRIYAQRELWHLQDNPLYHGPLDGKIILIRASQGHSGARVNISFFTRELTIDDDDLPVESVHGTQGPMDSIMQHGLISGGLSANGTTPTRARDMVHFAVSLPSRLRGLPQLAALHRHRRYMICFNLRAWLEDNRRAWLTENDVLLIRDAVPPGFFLRVIDQFTGRDILPDYRGDQR